MKYEVLGNCPVCDSKVHVSEIHCNSCNTTISGKFELCKFCRLSDEDKYFAEIFIKNRGNIKEIEKELGISYPTVKNKIDDLIASLGYNVREKSDVDKKSVISKLAAGEIDKEEALRILTS